MRHPRFAAGVIAAAVLGLGAAPARAQKPQPAQGAGQDLAMLRKDIDDLKKAYEAKIDDLEKRLATAEANAAEAKRQAHDAQASADSVDRVAALAPAPAPSAPTSQNAFNPGIAAVLNGFATLGSHEPPAAISGFAASDEVAGPPRGFSLGESEVSFAANIDPSLAGFLDFSIGSDNQVGLEEAYIRTTSLPDGLTIKAGRFLSGVGYLNERHAHDWSFSDAPLPYKAFLNKQYADDGVQVRWLAPTDIYLEIGAEAFRGENFPASGAAHKGAGALTAFVKTGGDIDASSSWLGGLSYLHASALNRATSADRFTGDSDLAVATLVYKWAPGGNPTSRNLALTGEYFYGRDKGAFDFDPVSQTHSGWYAQGVYQFAPAWSAGLRLAGLKSDDPGVLLARSTLDDLGHTPFAATALLEWDTSEFGRLRLQYTHDSASAQDTDELTLQYTVIYGPHGAHRY